MKDDADTAGEKVIKPVMVDDDFVFFGLPGILAGIGVVYGMEMEWGFWTCVWAVLLGLTGGGVGISIGYLLKLSILKRGLPKKSDPAPPCERKLSEGGDASMESPENGSDSNLWFKWMFFASFIGIIIGWLWEHYINDSINMNAGFFIGMVLGLSLDLYFALSKAYFSKGKGCK